MIWRSVLMVTFWLAEEKFGTPRRCPRIRYRMMSGVYSRAPNRIPALALVDGIMAGIAESENALFARRMCIGCKAHAAPDVAAAKSDTASPCRNDRWRALRGTWPGMSREPLCI